MLDGLSSRSAPCYNRGVQKKTEEARLHVFIHEKKAGRSGIPSGAIAAYIRAIEERRLCLHSLLIIRRGALVFEGQWAPMTSTEKHRLYSSSKSFVSMAIGLLVGDGKLQLSDRVVDFFPSTTRVGCIIG